MTEGKGFLDVKRKVEKSKFNVVYRMTRVLEPRTSGIQDYGIYYLASAEDIVK